MTTQKEKNTSAQTELGQVLEGLRREIYSGLRLPRERLVETVLADKYGVGRMAVRQALNRLAAERLVCLEPNRGASVAEVSLAHIADCYQVVAMLLGLAASLAAPRLGPGDLAALERNLAGQERMQHQDIRQWQELSHQFHRRINRQCGNARLIELIRENSRFTSYWFIVLSAPGRIPVNIGEHREILASLRQADAGRARRLVEEHILRASSYLIDYLSKNVPRGVLVNGL